MVILHKHQEVLLFFGKFFTGSEKGLRLQEFLITLRYTVAYGNRDRIRLYIERTYCS